MSKRLVILDLDETLIHSCKEWIGKPYDFIAENSMIHCRPGVNDFLAKLTIDYRVAIWTASYGRYTEEILAELFENPNVLEFVWTRETCEVATDSNGMSTFIKNISKLAELDLELNNYVIVDDKPGLIEPNTNVIDIKPYYGSTDDIELKLVLDYLSGKGLEKGTHFGWRTT